MRSSTNDGEEKRRPLPRDGVPSTNRQFEGDRKRPAGASEEEEEEEEEEDEEEEGVALTTEQLSKMSRSERKRCREKKRRNDVKKGFDELMNLLLEIDPVVQAESEDAAKKGQVKSGVGPLEDLSLSRVDLITRTVEVMRRIHKENEERKVIIEILSSMIHAPRHQVNLATSLGTRQQQQQLVAAQSVSPPSTTLPHAAFSGSLAFPLAQQQQQQQQQQDEILRGALAAAYQQEGAMERHLLRSYVPLLPSSSLPVVGGFAGRTPAAGVNLLSNSTLIQQQLLDSSIRVNQQDGQLSSMGMQNNSGINNQLFLGSRGVQQGAEGNATVASQIELIEQLIRHSKDSGGGGRGPHPPSNTF